MKALFKRRKTKDAVEYGSHQTSSPKEIKDQTIDNLVLQRVGKSKQEILELIKILKTF